MLYKYRYAQIDQSKCVGCKTCMRHCPGGAISVKDEGKAGYVAPCIKGCPAGINVPGYIALAREGDYVGAYRLIRQENPFPSVCGRICNHECESACNRGILDEPVSIREIKRTVSDKAYEMGGFTPESREPEHGKKVAVIGAGPSGLSCAYYLSLSGYDVDVFESGKAAGGVLYYGIPEYRLPKEVLARDIKVIEESGVNIHLNTTVGEDVQFEELRRKYHAIYLSNGAQFSRFANIPGETLPGVYHGLDFLREVSLGNPPVIGKKVVVIGGGNTAVDAARTALRTGAEKVELLYRRRRTDMPAEESELLEAFEEGIRVIELAAPLEITGDGKAEKIRCTKTAVSDYDLRGRRNVVPVEGSEFFVEADTVIVAVSQYSDLPFIDKEELLVNKFGAVILNDSNMTSIPGVFAGGDVSRGPDTAIRAINDGKQAAMNINDYLGAMGVIYKGEAISIPKRQEAYSPESRARQNILPHAQRVRNHEEVALGLDEEQMKTECGRCMECNGRVSIDPEKCLDCSMCWELCPQTAIHFKARPEPVIVKPALPGPEHLEQVIDICLKTHLLPQERQCNCANVTVEEMIEAILNGASTMEDVASMTGAGTGCGFGYCGTTVMQLLEAAGHPVEPGIDYHCAVPNRLDFFPDDAGDHDPRFKIRENKKLQWNDELVNKSIEAYRKVVQERSKSNE